MTPTDPSPGSNGQVTALDTMRRRRQREHLLDLRARLAETAAAHRAHNLPDAHDLARQQYAVEDQIREGWPELYRERWTAWVAEDARLLHTVGTFIADCTICVALARQAGVNIEPPDAA
jgi:hypothetical protein